MQRAYKTLLNSGTPSKYRRIFCNCYLDFDLIVFYVWLVTLTCTLIRTLMHRYSTTSTQDPVLPFMVLPTYPYFHANKREKKCFIVNSLWISSPPLQQQPDNSPRRRLLSSLSRSYQLLHHLPRQLFLVVNNPKGKNPKANIQR